MDHWVPRRHWSAWCAVVIAASSPFARPTYDRAVVEAFASARLKRPVSLSEPTILHAWGEMEARARVVKERRVARRRAEASSHAALAAKFRVEVAARSDVSHDRSLGKITNCVTPPDQPAAVPGFKIPKTGRDFLYFLRDELRPLQHARVADCGVKYVGTGYDPNRGEDAHGPTIMERVLDDGAVRASYKGLARCGNIHSCPVCLMSIRARYSETVREVVDDWRARHGGDESVFLLTLTVSHRAGDSFQSMVAAMGRLWTALFRGAPGKRVRARFGLSESCRAFDVTHGRSGWHPHLHALLFFERPLSSSEVLEFEAWLHERWTRLVVEELGEKFAPNRAHGVDFKICRKADYLTALGLAFESGKDVGREVVGGAFSKRAKGANRTPMQIAEDFALHKRPEDALLWLEYVNAMRGARLLTWSRGLRVEQPTIAEAEDDGAERHEVFTLSGDDWKAVRHVRGAKVGILKAVERGGDTIEERAAAGRAYVANLVALSSRNFSNSPSSLPLSN